jgi:hypothetical protein
MLGKLIVGQYVTVQGSKPKITYTDGAFLTQPKIAMTTRTVARPTTYHYHSLGWFYLKRTV